MSGATNVEPWNALIAMTAQYLGEPQFQARIGDANKLFTARRAPRPWLRLSRH
jgi:hypothetical protein